MVNLFCGLDLYCVFVNTVVCLCCRFNHHPVLNDRYLLLSLLGKGGFSEVHKVSIHMCAHMRAHIYFGHHFAFILKKITAICVSSSLVSPAWRGGCGGVTPHDSCNLHLLKNYKNNYDPCLSTQVYKAVSLFQFLPFLSYIQIIVFTEWTLA